MLSHYTASSSAIIKAAMDIFDRTVDKSLLVRRITITANNTYNEDSDEVKSITPDLFAEESSDEEIREDREKKVQER